jgi:hypothetical protein
MMDDIDFGPCCACGFDLPGLSATPRAGQAPLPARWNRSKNARSEKLRSGKPFTTTQEALQAGRVLNSTQIALNLKIALFADRKPYVENRKK